MYFRQKNMSIDLLVSWAGVDGAEQCTTLEELNEDQCWRKLGWKRKRAEGEGAGTQVRQQFLI